MKYILLFFFTFCLLNAKAQSFTIKGELIEANNTNITFASVVLKNAKDSSFVKAELTNEAGAFLFEIVGNKSYFIEVEYLGFKKFTSDVILLEKEIDLGTIKLVNNTEELGEVTVKAKRSIIEIKADRNIFNVQGTINSAGENGLTLLRKAPGVRLDNNDNISVLGRSGVLVYVDGKRVPLTGDDLTNYLQSLTSEQIDRIEIITNPGAKYEAQGNAGIIDIRLKKDKNQGANASINLGYGQGKENQFNIGGNGNYRKGKTNIFGSANFTDGGRWNQLKFKNFQNQLLLDELNTHVDDFTNYNFRLGADYNLTKNSTLGFIISTMPNSITTKMDNVSKISKDGALNTIDSVLLAPNTIVGSTSQKSYNLNYAYAKGNFTVNIDGDYATYTNDPIYEQPNFYYRDLEATKSLSSNINRYETPSDISINAIKIDVEQKLGSYVLGYGAKRSDVNTDNTFNFYNKIAETYKLNNRRSNQFNYDEVVNAGYITLNGKLGKYVSFTSGLRGEQTNIKGILTVFSEDLKEAPFVLDSLILFPTLGFTYSKNPNHSYALKYGKRINRPDYKVLNPFREQLSELSYSRGNKSLQPEIVNNIEFSYTLKYMYNFSLSYSNISNQITRLIGPDPVDSRASYISWDNLATQKLLSLNVSIPHQFNKWWSSYFNGGLSYIDNQADYGMNGKVDVQALTYNIYQQQTFSLTKGFKGEFSGFYSGPGVWGGVFLYEALYSLDLGLSKKFLQDKFNVRLSASDIFFTSGWKGVSTFNGLRGEGSGNYDSRRINLALNYDFGNFNVKSRKRSTSSESELKRIQN
jgi:iron complex outermembrane recepter protein